MDSSSTTSAPAPKPVLTIVARELLRCCPQGKLAMQDAEQAIRRGHITATAGFTSYLKTDGTSQTAGLTIVSDRIWQRIVDEEQRDRFWKKGAVSLPSTAGKAGYELMSITLDPIPLIQHLDRFGLAITVDAAGRIVPPSGARAISAAGRNAYAHGAPIAKLTLELAQESAEKLSAVSALSLVASLRRLYTEMGIPVPTDRNLEGFAGGVLSVIRSPRMPDG
jgi:hypothetical protein